jgi:transposase
MDFKIRTTKTASGKTAVQVVNYVKRKVNVVKHIGSTDDVDKLILLKEQGKIWIIDEMGTKGLFKEEDHFHKHYQYLGFLYLYAYEFLEKIYIKFNFHNHFSPLFKDLTIVRILEPKSKRDSLAFLNAFLNKTHSENVLYKAITHYDNKVKDIVEKEVVGVAKKDFGFDFSFVLYDVTTLYFESFKHDDFKRPGFSKDNKHNQPQVVIGLIVTKEGFPISYQIFKGNTFEGNTFLPIILDFKKKYNIESLTVVADSAMLSKQNLDQLLEKGFNYIIASRLANLKETLINRIDKQIKRVNGKSIRLGNLIVDYSSKRYVKDKRELDKQVEKAKLLENTETEKITNIKYLRNDKTRQYLNKELIDKNTKLLGLKGYVTNLTGQSNGKIIDYYHNLFKIEHAFRIAKSDLEARPVYHHKEESIKNHILICFLALTISVYLELKNKKSIASIVETLKSITDAKILNKLSKKIILNRVNDCRRVENLEKMSY